MNYMTKNKKQIYLLFIYIGIFLVFLDAYELGNIPLPWLGLVLLFIPPLIEINNFNDFKILKYMFAIVFVISIPQIMTLILNQYNNSEYVYIALRYFNIVSFLMVLRFSYNFFESDSKDLFIKYMKNFIIYFSLITVYIYFAQIFDLFEFERTRQNTNLFGESSQSTFWLSQPHRAMSTFREPVFLITFFFPIVLIYFYFVNERKTLLPFLSGIALGLTRSDYVRLFCFFVLLFLLINYVKTKEIIFPYVVLIISILIFSTIGVLECNINPQSIDCQEYQEDLEKINSSGEIKLKSNTSNPITDLDSDRIDIIYYFYQSLLDIKPSGLANVNIDYQSYSAIQISEEMYFTNRTLPSYLLTRYSTQNFGTGNYSVLKYVPNVQNLLIFYTNAFGFIFPAIVFLILLHILNKFKFRIETIFFLMMVVFVFISPIEEVNSFYGLIFGFLYKTLFNKDNEKI